MGQITGEKFLECGNRFTINPMVIGIAFLFPGIRRVSTNVIDFYFLQAKLAECRACGIEPAPPAFLVIRRLRR